jgi:GTP cyclohydrolase I
MAKNPISVDLGRAYQQGKIVTHQREIALADMAEQLIKQMLLMIEPTDGNKLREGIEETPRRVVKSWRELYAGYAQDPAKILSKTFAAEGYDEVIICRDIEMYSLCEHHLLPFYGKAHVGYIPGERVVGLSKLARLVDCYSRRLQIQERLTTQIADAIVKYLDPKGVAVTIESKHMCMSCRGINKQSSFMVTNSLRGVFREDAAARAEYLKLIKG